MFPLQVLALILENTAKEEELHANLSLYLQGATALNFYMK